MSADSLFIAALTGGIASGKTAVSDRLAALGVPVVDTDLVARQVVEPEEAGLAALVALLGDWILDSSGRLHRRRLRQLVFKVSAVRRQVERILHPLIMQRCRQLLQQLHPHDYAVIVIPLLAETGVQAWMDCVIVVDVEPETQIQRLLARDDMPRSQALAMINAQASREQRLAIADMVISNNQSMAELERQVDALHQRLLQLSKAPR